MVYWNAGIGQPQRASFAAAGLEVAAFVPGSGCRVGWGSAAFRQVRYYRDTNCQLGTVNLPRRLAHATAGSGSAVCCMQLAAQKPTQSAWGGDGALQGYTRSRAHDPSP